MLKLLAVAVPLFQFELNMHKTSFVTMPSEQIKKLCLETLDWIKLSRHNQIQKLVEKSRNDYIKNCNTWWGKLWKKTVPSDEEILEELKGTDDDVWSGFEYEMINRSYRNLESLALELLIACSAVKEINISVVDLAKIS